jgi:hypothetical protein
VCVGGRSPAKHVKTSVSYKQVSGAAGLARNLQNISLICTDPGRSIAA